MCEYIIASQRGRFLIDGKRQDGLGFKTAGLTTQYIEPRKDQKSNCLTTVKKDNLVIKKPKEQKLRYLPEEVDYRDLTPIECERLQTVPDNYTNHVSNTQRYKMLGNGWTVDVICHILSHIPEEETK